MPEEDQRLQGNQDLGYILLAGIVALLSLAGYAGYVAYPRFDLPAASGIGLLVLAAGAGLASFFSPCSFPLLVTLLAREGTGTSAAAHTRLRRTAGFATALAIGATVFITLTGIGIALGASTLFESVTFTSATGRVIRLVMGMLLILLGLIQLDRIRTSFDAAHTLSAPLMRRQARLRRERPTLGFGLFGFVYILAGFG